MRLFGLIGSPLTHSFSQKYFTRKFEKEGIPGCRYELFPLASIDELPGLLKSQPGLEGLNVTIPYKKQVIPFLAAVEIPEGLHACNCIRIEGNTLIGYNTDVTGFQKSLVPLLEPWHNRALVLGNGGATEAVVFVLKKLGIAYQVVSRGLHAGSDLTYADLDEEIVRQHPLVINTTPLGTFPDTGTCAPIPYEGITGKHLLYDLVYNPPKTLFLQKGEERGARIKNGEEMLIIQAEESWKIWNRP
ncbi:MAG: shikimate dehydrogenase [Sphingobacteriales bacterium]|nr:shikimate dehydrogenase [Sphingobacteriales bacterium]